MVNHLTKWFIGNPIAANLLMIIFILGGYLGATNLQREVYPAAGGRLINISMNYNGAAPTEVEKQICIPIEEAITGLEGVEQISSRAEFGLGLISVRVTDNVNIESLFLKIKQRIDAISTFPEDAEDLTIQQQKQRTNLVYFVLYGGGSEFDLTDMAEHLKSEVYLISGVGEVSLSGIRDREIAIEVSEKSLEKYNLTFDEISSSIRKSSVYIPAGKISSHDGDIKIKTLNLAYKKSQFENIVIRGDIDQGSLLLGDVATVYDTFSDINSELHHNKKPAVLFRVLASEDADAIHTTRLIDEFIAAKRETLPPDMSIKVSFKAADMFEDRIRLILENAVSGLLIVFVLLMIFMRASLAIWVCSGIIVSFCGALFTLQLFDIRINMFSLFAFLLVIGIIVDDAIIVSENIYSQHADGMSIHLAAGQGTAAMSKSIILAAASTIIFFTPILFLPYSFQDTVYPIFVVVSLCLVFSLIECLFLLPAHLSKRNFGTTTRVALYLEKIQMPFVRGLSNFRDGTYKRTLQWALGKKASFIASFIAIFIISVGAIRGGWIATSFFPNIPEDYIEVYVALPEGTSITKLKRIVEKLTLAAEELESDSIMRERNQNEYFVTEQETEIDGTNVRLYLGLTKNAERHIGTGEITSKLRELIGKIPEALSYSLDYTAGPSIPDIMLNINISSDLYEDQKSAAIDVSNTLAQYMGVYNVRNGFQGQKNEIQIELKPSVERLDVSLSEIGKQIRQGFHGEEVQRLIRGKDTIKVMLRYTKEERSSLVNMKNMRIRTENAQKIPLKELVNIKYVPGFQKIARVDRKRNINVNAYVEKSFNAYGIVAKLKSQNLEHWKKRYPGFDIFFGDRLKRERDFKDAIKIYFVLAIITIYCMLAISFRSYWQPLLVMTAIPFGFVGAMLGHIIVGVELSMMSALGFLACSGVVLNDNLVLLHTINRNRQIYSVLEDIVVAAATQRFRPIFLTSLTTFAGLLPIIFEESVQGQHLIPMAVSLAFGVVFATLITLLLVPCIYVLVYRARDYTVAFFAD